MVGTDKSAYQWGDYIMQDQTVIIAVPQGTLSEDLIEALVGDFDGTISDLRYFDTALNVFQINNIAMAGPNMQSESKALDTRFDYLSSAWYSPS